MGQSLYRHVIDYIDRLGVYIGLYGICGLPKKMIKWMRKKVENWPPILKTLKSRLCGEKKERQR